MSERYFAHALAGDDAPDAVRLRLRGRIRVGAWLPFDSIWEGDGRSFSWRAKAGPLRVHDQFRAGLGSMAVALGRLPLLSTANDDVARSGAGRAALEALWTPASLLPERGVEWREEGEDRLVVTLDVPPERPEIHIALAPDGRVTSYWAPRWRNAKLGYVPFGADVHAERTFGAITIPSRFIAGWGYGTGRWAPFFDAEVVERLG